jgi:hypothetical protein
LAELPSERVALMRWLEYQKQRFGGRDPNIHQRGNPVSWFRIGFGSAGDAHTFLGEFFGSRKLVDVRARWVIPQREGVDAVPAAPSLARAQAEQADAAKAAAIVSASYELPDCNAHEPPEEIEQDDWKDEDEELEEHSGNLSNEDYSLACIPVLMEHVLRQTDEVMETLTYEELARRLGRLNKHGQPAARGLGFILGRAMEHIDHATSQLNAAPPYLTTVVVDKSGPNKGLPGVGVRERWRGYEQLTRAEKADRVAVEYLKILQFGSRWNDLLTALGLGPSPDGQAMSPSTADASGGGWAGGESAEHKACKEYVRTHPKLFGAGDDDWQWRATVEYALRSGDEIDVFVKSDSTWIGVEVKSAVSDGNLKDYERGLYQVVKYRAVLSAQAEIDHPLALPEVRVVLALDRALPPSLRAVAQLLKVQVVENLGLVARKAECVA